MNVCVYNLFFKDVFIKTHLDLILSTQKKKSYMSSKYKCSAKKQENLITIDDST